jgi:uncharacterized protein YndB with AHSA1/START domain
VEFENTVTIKRARPEVFAYLAALEHTPEWNYAIESTTKTSAGAVGVGSEYAQTRTIPRRMTERLRITEFQPDEVLTVEGDFGPFRGTTRYELVAVDDGTTRLTNSVALRAGSVLGLLGSVLGGNVQRAVGENLGVLRRTLESV